jgi:predicted DNA binding CopG/RHH family protein
MRKRVMLSLGWMLDGTYYMWFTLSVKRMSFGLFQHVKQLVRREQSMKIEALKQRLNRNRPMTSVTIRMPEDVIEDLKKVAPLLGFSGYQPLIRAYIGQGLRVDLERFESETVTALVASLKRRGVSDAVIDEALSEVVHAESS